MKLLRSITAMLTILSMTGNSVAYVSAVVDETDFAPRQDESPAKEFTLDSSNEAGAGETIQLKFGAALSEYLEYNIDAARFELSSDFALEGNELEWFRIENLAGDPGTCHAVSKGRVYYNTTGEELKVCNGTAWGKLTSDANALDTLDSTQFIRSDASDNYTSGTLTFDNGTTFTANGVVNLGDGGDDIAINSNDWDISSTGAVTGLTELNVDNVKVDGNTVSSTDVNGNIGLDPNGTGDVVVSGTDWSVDATGNITTSGTVDGVDVSAIGAQAHSQNTDSGSTTNTYTLDSDSTGGDVVLKFGTTLAESLTWNSANDYFVISDALVVDGNLNIQDTTFRLDSDNVGVGVTVDIVAEQGTDLDGTLRYSTVSNQ